LLNKLAGVKPLALARPGKNRAKIARRVIKYGISSSGKRAANIGAPGVARPAEAMSRHLMRNPAPAA